MPRLRLGVLSTANIAIPFIEDLRDSPSVEVKAVASRNKSTAEQFAQTHGLAQAYGDYESLISDPNIDALYIPLPNSMHCEWALRAMQAGKHVLCEKPLVLKHSDALKMFDCARHYGRVLIEAFPFWFQPQTLELLKLLKSGELGDVKQVQSSFGFSLPVGPNIRLNAQLGGGALFDAGCYAVSIALLAMDSVPSYVSAVPIWSASGVDIAAAGTLLWRDGRTAQISCSMQTGVNRHAIINATKGVIETNFTNHTSIETPAVSRVRRGAGWGLPFENLSHEMGSGFKFEAETLARIIHEGDSGLLATLTERSLQQARTLEALYKSLKSGQSEAV